MRRTTKNSTRQALLGCLAAGSLLLVGCGQQVATPGGDPGTGATRTTAPGDDAAATTTTHPDPSCPDELPLGEDPSGHGFGVEEDATAAPSEAPTGVMVPEDPDAVWTCRYTAAEVDTTEDGGAVYGWRKDEGPDPVDPAALPELQAALEELYPPPEMHGCTAELGPRFLVVLDQGDRRVGIQVDRFGCRSTRFTGDPDTIPAGAQDQEGLPGGVLHGGGAILQALDLN